MIHLKERHPLRISIYFAHLKKLLQYLHVLKMRNGQFFCFTFCLFVENQYYDYNGTKINHLIIGQNMWRFALLYWVLRNKCAFENDMITFWICTLFQTNYNLRYPVRDILINSNMASCTSLTTILRKMLLFCQTYGK